MTKKFLLISFFLMTASVFAQKYSAEDLFNDIKNVTTVGYKAIDLNDIKKLSRSIHKNGVLTTTGMPFDFAILGQNGFFKVKEPKTGKPYYTRNGRFYVGVNRMLMLENGFELMPSIQVKKKAVIKTEIKDGILLITYEDGSVQKDAMQVFGFDTITDEKEGIYFTSDEVYELFGVKIYTGVVEQSNMNLNIMLLLLQNCLYKMRDEKKSQTYAAHQIDMINKFFADDIVVYSPDDLYDRTVRENGTLPKNFIREADWKKWLKEFKAEEVF